MAWGVAARSPVAINANGFLTYEDKAADRWDHAIQFARERDANAFIRLCWRDGLNTYGADLQAVKLPDRE